MTSFLLRFFFHHQVTSQDAEFAPHVTATCKSGSMNIRIQFTTPYNGVVHARDFRSPACMTFGNGSAVVGLSLNLLAKQGNSEYCGILVSNVSGGEVRNVSCFLVPNSMLFLCPIVVMSRQYAFPIELLLYIFVRVYSE